MINKILLIQPWNYHDEAITVHNFENEWRNGPYSLLMLATVLSKNDFPVRLIDLQPVLVKNNGDKLKTLRKLTQELDVFKPDIIGISFFSYQVVEVKHIIQTAKEFCATIGIKPIFIAGGIHASIEPHETIRQLGFDFAFVGEGELGIIELAKADRIESVQGIVSSHSPLSTGLPVIDLDSLPFPDWQLCDVDFYTFPSFAKTSSRAVRTIDILMGRGCAYRCSFCAYSTLSNVRYHSAENLTEQIKYLRQTFNLDSVYFIDSSIGNNRKLLVDLCRKIIADQLNVDFEWYANIRANQVDEELLLLMWEAGCRFLFYGFESGSQRILDLMNKKCTVDQNIAAAQIHNKLQFPYHASFILGYPSETEGDIKLTQELIANLKPYRSGINWYVPLPGSDDYNKLRSSGHIELADPHEWRRIGEVLTTGRVYASIDSDRFRELFATTCNQANEINTKHHGKPWSGPILSMEVNMSSQSTILENKLREKWQEIPATRQDRAFSSDLLGWSDDNILEYWEECRRQTTTPDVRGWFQDLYKDDFKGMQIADVGPGVGVDGIFFAQRGAHVTFVDIVEDNLKLLERICTLKGIKADYYFIDDFFSYRFNKNFDAFLFIGSMINAPFDFTQKQLKAMLEFLRPDGKVLMLGYPKERYIQLGAKSCEEFGKMTDGERTPWCEWYDDDKVRALFGSEFHLNWSRNFGADNTEFNWFDLTKYTQSCIAESASTLKSLYVSEYGISIQLVHVFDLDSVLGFDCSLDYPKPSLTKKFSQWKMEVDDAPIFRYIYRNAQPRRHLEFGTWQGKGTLFCLEECAATVWTINRPFGEKGDYGFSAEELPVAHEWAQKIGIEVSESGYSSDSIGFIGKSYLERNLGNRVCQIYCDSTQWDTSNFPVGFFDTVLIDGGHEKDIVISDTRKALPLLRTGGIIMWHDFCPTEYEKFESTKGVMAAIAEEWGWINQNISKLFWVYPSMILVGIKK